MTDHTPRPMEDHTLRSIEEDMAALDALLDEIGGDITDEEAEAAIDQWLAENEKNLKQKLDGYCTVIKGREEIAGIRLEEVNRLKELAATDLNAAAKLRQRLLYFFQQHPGMGRKLETKLFKLAVARNGGRAPVEIDPRISAEIVYHNDPGLRQFIRVSYSYDMTAIHDYLAAGGELPFATLGERGEHLRIR